MIKAQCDRCGKQAETSGSVVGLTIGIMQTRQTKLPQGWHRVPEPVDDERIEWPRRELCPECVEALRDFFRGDGAVAGLLSPETIASVEERAGCTCPKPEEPRPPCPLHEVGMDDVEAVFRDAIRAERRGCIAHGGPDCICPPEELPHDTPECPFCPRPGYQLTNEHIREVHPDRWDEWAELEGVDPRPNLTERARKLASGQLCVCAGVGFGTEDCPAHHPNGVAEGTHLPCTYGREGDECPGIFRRGMFAEHMKRWHEIPIAPGSLPCPYCSDIHPSPNLGGHIAKAHPGDWQAWIDGGQNAG